MRILQTIAKYATPANLTLAATVARLAWHVVHNSRPRAAFAHLVAAVRDGDVSAAEWAVLGRDLGVVK